MICDPIKTSYVFFFVTRNLLNRFNVISSIQVLVQLKRKDYSHISNILKQLEIQLSRILQIRIHFMQLSACNTRSGVIKILL